MPCGNASEPAGKLPPPKVVAVPQRPFVLESLAASRHPPHESTPVVVLRLNQTSASTCATAYKNRPSGEIAMWMPLKLSEPPPSAGAVVAGHPSLTPLDVSMQLV